MCSVSDNKCATFSKTSCRVQKMFSFSFWTRPMRTIYLILLLAWKDTKIHMSIVNLGFSLSDIRAHGVKTAPHLVQVLLQLFSHCDTEELKENILKALWYAYFSRTHRLTVAKKSDSHLGISVSSEAIHLSHVSSSFSSFFLSCSSQQREGADRAVDKREKSKRRNIESLRTAVEYSLLTETPWRKKPFSDARVWTLIQGKKLIVSPAWREKEGEHRVLFSFFGRHVHMTSMQNLNETRGKCHFLCYLNTFLGKSSFKSSATTRLWNMKNGEEVQDIGFFSNSSSNLQVTLYLRALENS